MFVSCIYCSICGICFASIHATHIETYKLCGDKANATGCLYTCCMCFHVCIYLICGICVLHIFYMQNQRLNNISGLPKPAARKLVIQKWSDWIPSRERTHIPPNRFPSSKVFKSAKQDGMYMLDLPHTQDATVTTRMTLHF